MGKEEMLEIVSNCVFVDKEKMRGYLTGKVENLEITKRIIVFPHKIEEVKKFDCFDNEGSYVRTEGGEVLIKFAKWLYGQFPESLSELFRNFRFRYAVFKEIGVSERFLENDLGTLEYFLNSKRYIHHWKTFLNYVQGFSHSYKATFEKIIDNYENYSGNYLLIIGVLLVAKNSLENNLEDMKKLEKMAISLLKKRLGDEKVVEYAKNYFENREFLEYYEKLVPLSFDNANTDIERIFIKLMMEKLAEMSAILRQSLGIEAIFSPHYFLNSENVNLMKIMENLKFSAKAKILYFLKYYTKNEYLKEDENIAYKNIEKIIESNPDDSISVVKKLLDSGEETGIILLSLLLKKDVLDEEEKKEYLPKAENIIIGKFKNVFRDNNSFSVTLPKGYEEDFEFLRKQDFLWKKVKISISGYNANHTSMMNKLELLTISLLDYSTVFKNGVILILNIKTNYYHFYSEPYRNFFQYYKYTYSENSGNMYINLTEFGIPVSMICNRYLSRHSWEYTNWNSIKGTFVITTNKYTKNKREFIEFLQEKQDKIYEAFENDSFNPDRLIVLVQLMTANVDNFDYAKLPMLFKHGKKVIDKVEKILRNKEKEARFAVEPLVSNKKKTVSEAAIRLIRFWDNDKIKADLEKMENIDEINEYLGKFYTKSSEKNVPFTDKINYGNIRQKNSEEKVPEQLVKYYISEYMALKDSYYIIEACRKIEEISNINDLRNLLKNIFEIWVEEGVSVKYRNVFVPLVSSANDVQLLFIQEKINFLATNGKPALAAFGTEVLGIREDKSVALVLNNIAAKFKNKRVKDAAAAALEKIAENMNVSREELDDILIPDFGFGKDRIRIYNYGEREIKAILNNADGAFKISLFDNNGKEIKSLPKASKKYNDNEEMVEEYKSEMKVMKKQLKDILNSQKARLLKALIDERKWQTERWVGIFVENPVMQVFATGLVWKEMNEEGKIVQTFRYMDDGTFNTADEEEYELNNKNHFISLVHPLELEDGVLEMWKEQLEDYEVVQPIMQLDIPVYEVTKENENATEITDYSDKEFYVSTLRSNAAKLDFAVEYEDYGAGEGCGYYDEKNNIKIVIQTDEFFPGDYGTPIKIKRIIFLEGNTRIDFVSDANGKNSKNNVKLLELKDVPKKTLSLACMMAKMLIKK